MSGRGPIDDLDAEIRDHLERDTQDHINRGLSPEEARSAAHRKFGSVMLAKEDARAVWTPVWLDQLRQDVRYACRALRRSPGFAAVVIATLTLGIGLNAAMFSVVNAVLLRPLTVTGGDRIVRFLSVFEGRPNPGASLPIAKILLRQAGVFQNVSARRLDLLNLTGTASPQQIPVARVTSRFFSLYAAPVIAGRTFSADDDQPHGPRVTVLSYGLWLREFGARPDLLGKSITLGSQPYIVIGILGAGFDTEQFTQPPDAWIPFQLDPNSRDVGGEFCDVSAALAPGATIETANTQLQLAATEYQAQYLPRGPKATFIVRPARDVIAGPSRQSLLLLEGAVGLVLLIACANVANLLLIRGTVRARELAVRAAIGAGRGRLLRQLLAEGLVLIVIAAVVGLCVGMWGIRVLLSMYPGANPTLIGNDGAILPRVGDGAATAVTIDWRVLAFTIGIALVATMLAAMWPALQSSHVDLQQALKGTAGGTSGVRHRRVRAAFVVSEIALALMLVVGAGLLIRTSLALRSVQPGFDSHNVITMRMSVSGTPFERRDGIARLTRDGLDRIRAIPGVTAASTTCCMPLESVWQLPFVIERRPDPGANHPFVGWTFVSPGYFDVFRIPIVRGRDFTERDNAAAPGVVIINEEMARRFWPGEDPLSDRLIIGRGVRPDYEADPIRQIIGVVGDVRDQGLNRNPRPEMYVPVGQVPDGVTILNVRLLPIVWLARTVSEPHAVGPVIEKTLQHASGGLPVARIRSMDEVEAESTARTRFDMLLMSIFAVSALVLAAVGIYGLMAYAVEEQTKAIGIRLALGASPARIRRMLLEQGMTLAAVGILTGIVASFWLARVLAGVLFGVIPRDPAVFVSVSVLLTFVSLVAVAVPAFRAARRTPVDALRCE